MFFGFQRSLFGAFLEAESGATAVEYALMGTLIAVAIAGILTALGGSLSSEFSEVSSVMK